MSAYLIPTTTLIMFVFDFSPAKGTAVGYITYQEKSGFYQLVQACWRDTTYSECEFFDPNGQKLEPGKYKIDCECTTLFRLFFSTSIDFKLCSS